MAVRLALVVALASCGKSEAPAAAPRGQTIEVAVIGGMIETGFWQALAERYELVSGNKIHVAATGPKPQVIAAFRKGGIELITVHASDAMINLVADGVAIDPQPWARNDLVIVGPAADPAKIKGERDALVALRKIVAAKAPLLVHASMGADGVLHDLQEIDRELSDRESTILFDSDNQHEVLAKAAASGAYTMVGRIPFKSGKLKAAGVELMVEGDPRLRRPYLVELSPTASPAARDLAAYLRSTDTQHWIATWGVGKLDDQPVFFPVTVQ